MIIRTRYLLTGVHPRLGDRMEMTVAGQVDATVAIWNGPHPHPNQPSRPIMAVEATTTVDPPVEHSLRFEAIAGGAEEAQVIATVDDDPVLADEFLDYCEHIVSALSTACFEVFQLTRWRTAAASPHWPFSSLGSQFSLDGGDSWHRMPLRFSVTISSPPGVPLTTDAAAKVQALIDGGLTEPVAHELLREAMNAVAGSPRSAVVIGVAAAETGFKRLVSMLVPNAAWLMENTQSPPLVKMLKEFLPSLPARWTLNDVVHTAPKYVRTLLTNGVEARNEAVHRGSMSMQGAEVSEFLDAVQDLLYLFDFYAGNRWAIDLISDEFKTGLGT